MTSEYPQDGGSVVVAMITVLMRDCRMTWPPHVMQNESAHKMVAMGKRADSLY